jgi:hypothetical protein
MKHDYCVACANTENLHQHHLIPKSRGGSNDETNLITLCGECHAKIHGNRSKWNTSELTKSALKAKKESGATLGNRTNLNDAQSKGRGVQVDNANAYAANLKDLLTGYQSQGKSLHEMARRLNQIGVKTARGGEWYAKSVSNVISRLN